ncbi:50S ribosomal protein L25/general stress protein Ctc [Saccharomonospora sp. CUA-673]|uniref:50S ribosomal protein L25/general stress protein Ctc n=1 Tax=Saccharomonospora sp. CUA-673 TaxID=1904969 RepID=UPI00095F09AE|nr:50S ribosomal protein L25/general stress protein Ctc [Saccharomonospora sp. CUA-673]OLT49242.1 50S ribosomal protein L25/general stress protein Ctc [Saccharomonospora sp. CUA-673]
MSEVRLSVEPRTEFGKGAARRTRRAGKIPAVLYGHGEDPKHLALPAVDFARVVRENGQNAVITLDVAGATKKSTDLALTKTITVHPLKNYIEHVDLLVVRRGEKVTVDVPIVLTGTARPGTLVNQDVDTIQIEVEATHIPEQFEVDIEGTEAGHTVVASEVTLPRGAELVSEAETLIVAVNEAPTEEAMEADVDAEGAGVVEEESDSAEGENS